MMRFGAAHTMPTNGSLSLASGTFESVDSVSLPSSVTVATAPGERFDVVDGVLAAGVTAKEIGTNRGCLNLVATGEGPRVDKALELLQPTRHALTKGVTGRSFECTVTGPIFSSGDLAAAVSRLFCKPKRKGQADQRLSFVWQERGTEWRSNREVFLNGVME